MALSEKRLNSILDAQLDTVERKQGVVYVMLEPIRAGTTFDFPYCRIEAPWDAILAFVDRDPLANWGHSSRYVLINRDTGDAKSVSARFPPFQRAYGRHWRVFYKAPGVPDRVLAVPK
jgi:hypothetical protein